MGYGERTPDFISTIDKMQEEYGGIPFWSWNDRLEPEELRRQIRVMKELGMKGYFMHARGGLETEYLSDDWYDCVAACIDEGKKLNMESWAYDENGWPSGFGGGKLLKDPLNFATYLKEEDSAEFPDLTAYEAPEKRVLAVYAAENGVYKRVLAPVDGFTGTYAVVYQYYNDAYVDVLDEKIIKKFIECTHEEYKAKCGEDFGKAMPGFFTDEPQYYRYATPWSNTIPEKFREKYGYDVFDGLAALFKDYEGADEFRYDYWYLCHELFINSFTKQIYDWCEENGAKLTGHAVEESALHTQMWCCGGVMPFYEFEHMPGMDYLGRNVGTDLAPKQLGSVAAQLGKKKVLTETFACCGWDVSPRELKKIADLQYVSGVNVMCHHLYAYSIRGQRKRDYPANYSEHLPWQHAFGDFVKYYGRLGGLLSMGEELVNTLIIHPIHSDYLTYKREQDRASVEAIESGVQDIITYFGDRQMSYHFGDEVIMRRHGSVKGDRLIIGNMSYKYVVLPRIFTLDGSTVKLLKEFLAGGGKLVMFDDRPSRIDGRTADMSWLENTCTLADIENDNFISVRDSAGNILHGVKAMARHTPDFGTIYYITNVSGNDYGDVKLHFEGAEHYFEAFLEQERWKHRRVAEWPCGWMDEITTTLESGQSRIYLERMIFDAWPVDNGFKTAQNQGIELDDTYELKEPVENTLTLDKAYISLDGGESFQTLKPIIQIFDELLRMRYRGVVTLDYKFKVKDVPATLKVAVEPLNYKSVEINGKPVDFTGEWWLDRSFKVIDIAGFVTEGENTIRLSFDYYQDDYVYNVLYDGAMESLRNCLNFNTEVEPIYLFGDFKVLTEGKFEDSVRNSTIYNGDFVLAAQDKAISLDNVVKCGYPFYAGELVLRKEFEAENVTELWLDGRFAYADICLNRELMTRLMFTNHCTIKKTLKPGKNELVIRLCNSNRNLLGPHHYADPEPYALGPSTFSLESMWHDGKCSAYRDSYSFVRYGTKVILK